MPKLGTQLVQRQEQTLKMTPQLQQAIKLLQMSRLELESAIREELESNPLLEEVVDTEKPHQLEVIESEIKAPEVPDQDNTNSEFDWDSYFDKKDFLKFRGITNFAVNDEIINYENIISTKQSLHDYLMWQARMSLPEDLHKHAEFIIDYINDDGYLTTTLQEIANHSDLELEKLEFVLGKIQELDPPGVGARDLVECLILQAKAFEEDTHDLVTLIKNYLPLLEKKHYDQIAKLMGKDVREVREMAQIITSMDPKPGRIYSRDEPDYVIPDVYVYKVGDEIMVVLNDEGLPRLQLTEMYRELAKGDGGGPKEVKDYMKERLSSALWLMRSLQQRQRTIYRVTEAIMKHQRDFLEKGPAGLKPLTLKDIAQEIGVHESTVSRVTSNKYVHTPLGVYELKYFFGSGLGGATGEGMASEAVKLRIKSLIEAEDPRIPLSDQDIVAKLKLEGIQIARRTVAKYREALKILPASRRRKVNT